MEDRRKIEELLIEAAVDIPDEKDRALFLDWACREDPALRARVDKLVAVNESSAAFFDFQPLETADESAGDEYEEDEKGIGLRIGRYRLVRRLGEGGCGVVYQAEQETPVKRQVALKLIRVGRDHGEVIARFEAERQALAMMDHPGIARVLDAGATVTGRPYFVMQWVTGERITDFCDKHRLSIAERLALFIKVCNAVQHAHQKGVIHRDLKPSNVLASMHDGEASPKVIDFGIAKATGTDSPFTMDPGGEDIMLGTPDYMSPEQAVRGGVDVDTRTDIYSLGILLRELLAGRAVVPREDTLPLQPAEFRQKLMERAPVPPSMLLAGCTAGELRETAEERSTSAEKLSGLLTGDLDAIVLKCLQVDRRLRYATAKELALDLQRHLDHEPVAARPDSKRYRFGKFMRRHTLGFAMGALALFALVTAAAISTSLFFREKEALGVQERLRDEAELARANEAGMRANAETARANEARLRAAAEAREACAKAAVEILYNNLEKADSILAAIPDELVPPSLEAADSFRKVGDWHRRAGRWPEAAERYTTLVESLSSVDASDSDNVLRRIPPAAAAACEAGDLKNYDRIRRIAVERFAGTKYTTVAEQIVRLSLIHPADEEVMHGLGPAAEFVRRTIDVNPRAFSGGINTKAWKCFTTGLWNYRHGDYTAARDFARMAMEVEKENPVRIPTARVLMAMAEFQLGLVEEARNHLAQAEPGIRAVLAADMKNWENPGSGATWWEWVNAHTLLEEALVLSGRK